MTRIDWAGQAIFRGAELVERRDAGAGAAYPPYNILQPEPHRFEIVLAVAGFAERDLAITVEDHRLFVRGRQPELTEKTEFLHRGIAARAFQRQFELARNMSVEGANLRNGLLTINLRQAEPSGVSQTISINSGKGNRYE